MKLIKVKGVVIKETPYSDNDKILTLMTDKLGKISCMAKGAKKTSSALLAPCQMLVYSEFVLYKGTSFYHINSAEVINTFYSLRMNYTKLEIAYEISKILNYMTYEDEETDEILSLVLNTLYVIDKKDLDLSFVIAVFKLKLLSLIGYPPDIIKCSRCGNMVFNREEMEREYLYSLTTNSVLCGGCAKKEVLDKKTYISLSQSVYIAVIYIISSTTKKIFGFVLENKSLKDFIKFVDTYYSSQMI